MFIAAILLVQPKGYLEHRNWVGSQCPAEPISWIWIGWPRSTLGNWQKGRPTHLRLITQLLHVQFHIQFLITYSAFWVVNILLWMFDISSEKRNGKEKSRFLLIKNEKKMLRKYTLKKSIVCIAYQPPPSKSPRHSLFPMPPLNSTNCPNPLFRRPHPSILFFCWHSP